LFNRRLYGKLLTTLWLFSLVILLSNEALASTITNKSGLYAAFAIKADTLIKNNNQVKADTLAPADSLVKADTTEAKKDTTGKDLKLEYDLVRHADDSIVQDLRSKKVYLYGNAEITYGDIDLKAAYIAVDFNNNTVFAQGMKDTAGKVIGLPQFKQGSEVYDAKTIRYDFVTKKGIIHGVSTKQNEGYLHGSKVKRLPDNSFNVENGEFTTCDLPTPHYAFKFHKGLVIPGKLIVTGPVYMEVEGIPTPLALPFGIFPNNPKRTSGLIIPSYGESTNQGFYLQGGGYFWDINDHMTLKVTGDIYTGGSWTVSPLFTYKKRYRYNGSLALSLGKVILSTKGSPDYTNQRSFSIRWQYAQDPKTHPYGTFSANVNIMSRSYSKYATMNTNTYLSNTFSSSVSYQRNFGKHFHFTASGDFTQNVNQHTILLNLPTITFSSDQFYPFRKQNSTKKGLLDGLTVQYSLNAKNSLNTTDSTIFTSQSMRDMQNGIQQIIPISLPLKIFKYFTLSNSININDWIYTSSIRRRWVNDTTNGATPGVKTDTIPGFNNVFSYSLNTSLSTKIYGMVKFKKGPIRAIRHVISPSIGFSYTPDFSNSFWGYAAQYMDYSNPAAYPDGRLVTYSKFQNGIFGGPVMQKQENLVFSINNQLEIKVPSKKDTVTGMKKIPLIQDLTISGSYNFAADSLRLSPINVSGRTKLWKGLNLQYNAVLNPYASDSNGMNINRTVWEESRRLYQSTGTWNVSFNFSLGPDTFKKKKGAKKESVADSTAQTNKAPGQFPHGFQNETPKANWKIPWSLSLNYNFRYTHVRNYRANVWSAQKTMVQTLGFNGQLSFTKNWKFSMNSGWDFTNHQLSFTSVNIYRNLHCWEMRFSWIPLGPRKSWNFTLQIKAGMLKDLKLTKQKSFLENY
jgi:hypothetical protein